MLLKHFADENGILHFFNRESPEKGVRGQTPNTLFFERHLYTFTDLDGRKDFSTEEIFSKLEGEADPIICKIVVNARKGLSPNLSPAEKNSWAAFLYLSWSRLPAMRDSSTSSQAQLDEQQRAFKRFKGIPDNEAIDFAEFEGFLQQQIWPRAIQGSSRFIEDRILPTFSNMSLGVGVVSKEKSGHIIGSNPIIKVRPKLDLDNPEAKIWMPLAHDVAVVLRHGRPDGLFNATNKFTQRLNERVSNQSTIVAGRSREQIGSLASSVSLL